MEVLISILFYFDTPWLNRKHFFYKQRGQINIIQQIVEGDASNQLYSQKTETQKICVASQRINIECYMLFYTTIRNCYKENTLYECIAGTCCINQSILSIQVSLACQKHSNQFYPLRGWIVNKISFLFTNNQFYLQPLFHILEVITYESSDCRLIDILTLIPLRLSTTKIVLRWSS